MQGTDRLAGVLRQKCQLPQNLIRWATFRFVGQNAFVRQSPENHSIEAYDRSSCELLPSE